MIRNVKVGPNNYIDNHQADALFKRIMYYAEEEEDP